jgi:hypothetical protein
LPAALPMAQQEIKIRMSNPGDVFEFELFKNSLYSLADEMALTILRTAYSGLRGRRR